ncbi:sugar-binding domain-containing protein [Amycolatopsis sp. cmx-4-54]|uniref:sugar-binding domain-containing protein n=1 Tax=Amycolatopsis sp. cmx-4-54 TaxID=2790936 RepID=UPI00397B8950
MLLHFGAVDQSAEVWVNNEKVAAHEGGYMAFSADSTEVLRPSGSQELTVRATDRTDASTHPVGKQRTIVHTATSGIWQTLWLEPVPSEQVQDLQVTPDLERVTVVPKVTGRARVELIVSEPDGPEVARVAGEAGRQLRAEVPRPSPPATARSSRRVSPAEGL